MSQEQQLIIAVNGENIDDESFAELTRNLRRDVLELDVERAEFAKEVAPEGTKTFETIDWNTLILTLVSSGGVVTSLMMVLNSWVQRNAQTKLHVTLPNGGEIKFEGNLTQNQALLQDMVDMMTLGLAQQDNELPLFKDNSTLVALYKKMNEGLNLAELKTVTFTLGLDYEQLGGESLNKSGKIQLLIKHCERHDKLDALKSACQSQNSAVAW